MTDGEIVVQQFIIHAVLFGFVNCTSDRNIIDIVSEICKFHRLFNPTYFIFQFDNLAIKYLKMHLAQFRSTVLCCFNELMNGLLCPVEDQCLVRGIVIW